MTPQSADAMALHLGIWVLGAIVLAAGVSYFLRPRTRARFEGGNRRYFSALLVQAAGFMAPIPVVLVLLMSVRIWPGLDVVVAVLAGVAMVTLLRYLPMTGPLLRDLQAARVAEAMDRLGPRR